MPPRYAYWTILIDQKPTAFRARDRAELAPTLRQLQRTNADVVMKWFARGRLWESPEQERAVAALRKRAPRERRARTWRPGGEHRDPRARFKEAEQQRRREKRARHDAARRPKAAGHAPPRGDRRRPHGKFRPRTPQPRNQSPQPQVPERRDGDSPPRPSTETAPEPPAPPEQIVIKPEPPERG